MIQPWQFMVQELLHRLQIKGKGQLHLVLTSVFISCSEDSTQARALADANQESSVVISVRLIYNNGKSSPLQGQY